MLAAEELPFDVHGRTNDGLEDPASVLVIERLSLRVREQDVERARALPTDRRARRRGAGGSSAAAATSARTHAPTSPCSSLGPG